MSHVRAKNPAENQDGYRAIEFSSVLSEMQAGDLDQCITIKDFYYQRAGRTDAEPIIHESDLRNIGSVFFCFMIVCLENEK